MIPNEIFQSDVIYIGAKFIPISEFKSEFPDWYENWKKLNSEYTLRDYLLIPDYGYGISATLNAIYTVDFEKVIAEYLCSFEHEKNEGGLYHPPVRMRNVMLFAPCNARCWAYFDLDTKEWSYEDIPAKFIKGEGPIIKSCVWIPIGNRMIYMPGSTTVVMSVDLKNGKISYHDCLRTIKQTDGTLPEFTSIIAYGDSVLLFTNTGNEVYEIDVKTMQLTNIHRIPMNCNGVFTATSIPETDWIFLLDNPQTSRIIKWDVKTGVTEEIKDLPIRSDEKSVPSPILGFCYDYSGLYIIPQQDNCVVKINYCENKARRIDLFSEVNLWEKKDEFYYRWGYGCSLTVFAYNGYKNTTTVCLPYDFSIAEIDFDKGTLLNRRKWKINGIENLIRQSMMNEVDGLFMENKYFGLKEFVDDINIK